MKKKEILQLKETIHDQKGELLTLNKISKNYKMKIKQEKKATGSWITFYDAVLYANGIINEDFYGTFRGNVARKFCDIFEKDLRPWKTLNEQTIKKFDEVSLALLFSLTKSQFLVEQKQVIRQNIFHFKNITRSFYIS